jgi:hypothetical protein
MAEDPKADPKSAPELQYEGPEIFELGDVEDLTFGPSSNKTPDSHDIQYDPGPTPC